MRRSERGQGTVELALGALVFVTVLIFGIHFAELGMMKLRVQQAAHSALFDTTALRLHDLTTGSFYSATAAKDRQNRRPAERASRIYGDFDGSDATGPNTLLQVFTRGSELQVGCGPATLARWNVDQVEFQEVIGQAERGFNYAPEGDGMACSAEATISAFRIPEAFAQRPEGSFFGQPHLASTGIKVCAFGRPKNGVCEGAVPMTYDDWGLAGSGDGYGNELEDCDFNCWNASVGGNEAYKRTVKRVYDNYYDNYTTSTVLLDFLVTIFSKAPSVHIPELDDVGNIIEERTFRFVFQGEGVPDDDRPPFTNRTREMNLGVGPGVRDFDWAVTPYGGNYKTAYDSRRGQCFLGSACNSSLFQKQGWEE